MLARAVGVSLEARFFEATMPQYYRELPGYLLALERATPFQDVRGIDVFAFVVYPWIWRPVTIPIQIKGSPEGVGYWQGKHRLLAEAGIVTLVISERHNSAIIRAQLSRELERRRQMRRRYDDVLGAVLARPLDARGTRIEREIVASRLLEPAYPAYRRPPGMPLLKRLRHRVA